MLRSLIFWKITKTTYLVALLLALVLLLIQVYRLSFIIVGLPITSSLPFFLSWFVYYSFFFLPDGIVVAVALTVYEMKEKKIIQVMESFHLSPGRILYIFSLPAGVFLLISLVLSFLLFEEQVSFARKGLIIKYKDRILENLPERAFIEVGNMVVYVREREENRLRGVFLKYRNSIVVADRASYEGGGRFSFDRGYLITKERGKYFLISFENYRLDTEERFTADIRKRRISKERIMNLVNTASIPFLFLAAFTGALRICRSHLQVYYLIAVCLIAHQILMFSLKITL